MIRAPVESKKNTRTDRLGVDSNHECLPPHASACRSFHYRIVQESSGNAGIEPNTNISSLSLEQI